MNKKEALINSMDHVLHLIDEEWNPETNPAILFSVKETTQMSYKNLEFLAVSLYYQLTYLEEKFNLTFYTLNQQYLFEVKRNGTTKGFVYGILDDVDTESIEESVTVFKRETGIATRYIPLMTGTEWKEYTDPTLILYAGLPIRFHYKTVYYSVAAMIEKLFGRDLSLITGTKLEGFIKRAKSTQIQKRILAL
jgi:hypothetical protein